MSDCQLNNYNLTKCEVIQSIVISEYGLRHLEQARQSTKCSWGHRIIGVIELFPIIGAIVSLIEAIVVRCLKHFSSPPKLGATFSSLPKPNPTLQKNETNVDRHVSVLGFIEENPQAETVRYRLLSVDKDDLPFVANKAMNVVKKTLYEDRGYKFITHTFDIPLEATSSSFDYVLGDKTVTVKTPGLNEPRKFNFCSCNDFQYEKERSASKEPYHMWRKFRKEVEQTTAPDVFLYGGDQGYFDGIFDQEPFKAWSARCKKGVDSRAKALKENFTDDMRETAERYYFETYLKHFSDSHNFGKALSSIPSWMSWDDHDGFDGMGSYDPSIENSEIVKGLKEIAKKYYFLFQQLSSPLEALRTDDFTGTGSTRMKIVGRTAVLAPDTRSFRTQTQVVLPEDWKAIMAFLEQNKNKFDHTLFVFPIPFVYADLNLIRKGLDAVNGILPPQLKTSYFGDLELIDDLDDETMDEKHRPEQMAQLKDFQKIRSWGKSVLVLGGDVHHGCQTEVRSKEYIKRAQDPNLVTVDISSSMVNKINTFAKGIPLTFLWDKSFTKKTRRRLLKIRDLENPKQRTTIIDEQNYLSVKEATAEKTIIENKQAKKVTVRGLESIWKSSLAGSDAVKQYRSFTPVLV